MNQLHSKIASLIYTLDMADSSLLKVIPISMKRRLTRSYLRRMSNRSDSIPLDIDGVKFTSQGSLAQKIGMIKSYNDLLEHWQTRLQAGMNVIDVGANVGFFTLFAARAIGPDGKVFSIEPTPDSIDTMRRNIELNSLDNIVILPFGAGSDHRRATLSIRQESYTLNSFFRTHPRSTQLEKTIEVDVAPVDELVQVPVHVVKIDVEGMEIEVLKGMQRTLESNPSLQLYVEWNPRCQMAAGYEPADLVLHLKELGFDIFPVGMEDSGPYAESRLLEMLPGLLEEQQIIDLYCVR